MSRWLHAAGVSTEVQKGQFRQKGQKPPIGAETGLLSPSVPSVPSVPYGLTSKHPITAPDPDAFEERAAIIHEAHTRTRANDGSPLPEPKFTISQEQAETLAAQERGHADADSFYGDVVERWAAEITRLATPPAVSPAGPQAWRRAPPTTVAHEP